MDDELAIRRVIIICVSPRFLASSAMHAPVVKASTIITTFSDSTAATLGEGGGNDVRPVS